MKLINVPGILDINGMTPNPTSESLTLTMIDYPTLSKISKFTQKTSVGSDLMEEGEMGDYDPDEEVYHEATSDVVTGFDSYAYNSRMK